MGVVVLHVFGVALETVLGIRIFSKMFPKREQVEWKQIFSEFVLNSLLLYTIQINFLEDFSKNCKWIIFIVLTAEFLFYRGYIEQMLAEKVRAGINILIFLIQFSILVGILSWNGWLSYISIGNIILGNMYLPFFLYRYFKSSYFRAHIYEVLYLTAIGLMKNVYMVFIGADEKLSIGSVNLSGIMHTYPVLIYGILINTLIYLCIKYFGVEKLLKKMIVGHMIWTVFAAFGAIQLLSLLTDLGLNGYSVKDLSIVLLFTAAVILLLLFVLARAFLNLVEGEKKLLDVRNEAMEQQYQELQEAYQQNRCLIHDQKHMIQYMVECLESNEIEKAISFARKYGEGISKQSKHAWTGLPTLDFILNMKKRKMDAFSIEFSLHAELEYLPIDDTDFVVLLGNLFDNAIDAAKLCEFGKREIDVFLRNVNEMFVLQMTNTSVKEPKRKKDKFITSKEEKDMHGLGLESVRRIVEKHGGSIDFEYDMTMFRVKILIDEIQ